MTGGNVPLLFCQRLDGRSLGAGKCRPSLAFDGHGRDAYFNDLEPGERRYHHRPGRPPNLRRTGLLRFIEVVFDLEADPLAFHILKLPEGLFGNIDRILDASRSRSVKMLPGAFLVKR